MIVLTRHDHLGWEGIGRFINQLQNAEPDQLQQNPEFGLSEASDGGKVFSQSLFTLFPKFEIFSGPVKLKAFLQVDRPTALPLVMYARKGSLMLDRCRWIDRWNEPGGIYEVEDQDAATGEVPERSPETGAQARVAARSAAKLLPHPQPRVSACRLAQGN